MKPHIVTAFFDIGWTGLPGTVRRSPEWYLENFKPLASLDNPLTVYTTSGYADRIRELAPHADVRERDCILDDYMRLLKRDVYSVQDELTLPYVALMYMKIDFVRYTYLVHKPETMAWVDFAGMRWYGKVEQTPTIPRAWDFPRPVERLVMFESEGRLSGSMWLLPGEDAGEYSRTFRDASRLLARDEQVLADDEYVWGYAIQHEMMPCEVLPLGTQNWFGAIHKYNGEQT